MNLQPLPALCEESEDSDDRNNNSLIKLPPLLKRKPMFFPVPTREKYSRDDVIDTKENNKEESEGFVEVEMSASVEKKQPLHILTDNDIEDCDCPICIDFYGKLG